MLLPETRTEPLDFLPEALVKEMLDKYEEVTSKVHSQLNTIVKVREIIRNYLTEDGILANSSELIHQKAYPTTAGVDGSYVPIKQLALDTVAIAAVAVEGLVPPKEERIWEKPHHIVNMLPLKHHPRTSVLAQALMFSYELELAVKAPHKVVYLDGSLTSQLIAFGQAFTTIEKENDLPEELRDLLLERMRDMLVSYLEVLQSKKVGKLYVGVPKYSSRAEIINNLVSTHNLTEPTLGRLNDKGLLTHILRPGEVVGPLPLTASSDRWHLSGVPSSLTNIRDQIINALYELYVLYFRPSPSHPALRLEVSKEIANSSSKKSILLESLEDQARMAGIIEPYPLYIADTFVSQIYPSLIHLKDITLSKIGASKEFRFAEVFLSLHEYRSEGDF